MEKEKIRIKKRICSFNKIINLTGDILVPDTKPDIISTIGSNGICYIKKEEIFESKIRLNGCFDGYIVYLSDLGETRCLKVNLDFLEEFENTEITRDCEVLWNMKIISKEVKILNERKVNLKIEIELELSNFIVEEIEFITDFDAEDKIQKLQNRITIKEYLNCGFTKSNVSEELNIDGDIKNIEIIKKNITIENIEKKISYNKLLVKADMNVSILYTQENQIKNYLQKIPIMSFIDIENVSEENIIGLRYDLKNFNIDYDLDDNKNLNCELDYDVVCNIYNKREITVIEDLYSLEKELKYTKQDIEMECIDGGTNDYYDYSEKINISSIKDIYDYNCYLREIKKNDSKNYEGILNVDIYYCKNDGGVLEKNVDIPFIISNNQEMNNFELDTCVVKSVSGEWICEFKIKCIKDSVVKKVSILNDCEITDCVDVDNYSMVIYYVKPNDTLWKIAKNFKISIDKIISLNKLSDLDSIFPGEKIYIMRG